MAAEPTGRQDATAMNERAGDRETYGDDYARQLERVIAPAWSYLADRAELGDATAVPAVHLPGSIDVPVAITAEPRVLSNVCTHRGAVLLDGPCMASTIRCPYHGRRFRLDGSVSAAPGFEVLPDEPLPSLAHATLGPMLFASLGGKDGPSFEAMIAPARERLAFVPFDAMTPDPASAREYTIDAHFALWCDNYLEGFHIPYVHPSLTRALDLESYEVHVHDHCVLQIGEAAEGEPAFELPDSHPDAGRRIGGYYLFVFPLTAINVYPWGVSLNAVQPLGPTRTRVVYRAYVWRPELRERGAGAGLDGVELEDDAIVERTALGVRSRLYRPGRLSPRHEAGVRWLHRRLRDAVGEDARPG